MMKKVLFILLALMITTSSFAQIVIVDKIQYSIDANTGNAEVYLALSSITEANIPSSVQYEGVTYPVTSIGKEAFYDCRSLTNINIPNSVNSIGSKAFAYCSDMTSVTLGTSVTSIGSYAFTSCPSITTVSSLNSIPPVVSMNDDTYPFFDTEIEQTATLHVPEGCADSYRKSPYWENFLHVEADMPNGIEKVTHDILEWKLIATEDGVTLLGADGESVKVYSLSGREIVNITGYHGQNFSIPKGWYIIQVGQKAQKMRF